jgi:hypothetical protein
MVKLQNLRKFWIIFFFSLDSTNLLIIWKFSPIFLYQILNKETLDATRFFFSYFVR